MAFARARAAEYGGDPATMIVFGWSGGAMVGAMVAFARPEPSTGCLAGTTLGAIDALITWEGDWLLSNPALGWDGLLAADPRLLANDTPWPYLAQDKDLKVVMLVSDHPGAQLERKVSDPGVADSFFAVRDPSGFCAGSSRRAGRSPTASSTSAMGSDSSSRPSRRRGTPSRSTSCQAQPTTP